MTVQTGTVLWQDNSTYNMFSANTTQISTSSETVVADPFFATNTVTLLNFDNLANGTTTLPTKDLSNNVWLTGKGTAQVSTSVKKYGTGSIYLPNNTSSITLSGSTTEKTNSSAFNLGTGNFTVELWAYSTANNTNRCMFAIHTDGGTQYLSIQITSSNYSRFSLGNSTNFGTTNTFTISPNTWYHYALVRNGTAVTLYVDGVAKSTMTSSTNIPVAPACVGRAYVDQPGAFEQFPGYIDDVRVTKGIARYTVNFTPPAGPFATS